jgi:hypothetical protein
MIAVNRAFEILHRILVEEAGAAPIVNEAGGALGASGETPNALAYLWTVRRLLFGIALDDWALEEASVYLDGLVPVHAPRSGAAVIKGLPFLIQNPDSECVRRMNDLVEQACRLTPRLCAAGMAENAARSFAIARQLDCLLAVLASQNEAGRPVVAINRKVRHLLHAALPRHPYVREGEECVAGTRKPTFVLDSVKQVENAFRLGAIDEKRYQRDLLRVARSEGRVEADRRDRLAILSRTQFAPLLPSDAQLRPSRNPGRMVPHPPPYLNVVEDLTPDQQAMYLEAFRTADNLDLIEWYAQFRLNSVLRSVILFTDRCDLASLAEEAEALARLGSVQDGCGWLGRATADVTRFIAALDDRQRPVFLSQLAKLLRPARYVLHSWERVCKLAERFGATTEQRQYGRYHVTKVLQIPVGIETRLSPKGGGNKGAGG